MPHGVVDPVAADNVRADARQSILPGPSSEDNLEDSGVGMSLTTLEVGTAPTAVEPTLGNTVINRDQQGIYRMRESLSLYVRGADVY